MTGTLIRVDIWTKRNGLTALGKWNMEYGYMALERGGGEGGTESVFGIILSFLFFSFMNVYGKSLFF
jgi:hypothetical protein